MAVLMLFSTSAWSMDLDSISPNKLLVYAKRMRYGINTDVNIERAAKIYTYLAKKGNAQAQRELGIMFLKGEGVDKNYKAAFYLLKKACVANDAKAICVMADTYQRGIGVRSNQKLALRLYLKASELGSAQGFYGVGNMLYKGLGVKQNYNKAEEYLLKGSEKGNAKCDFLLANYYAYGFGGTPNYNKAREFLDKAVKKGHGWTVDMTLFNKLDSVVKQNEEAASKSALAKAIISEKRSKVNDTSNILGHWKGTLVTYDWSKTRVLKEEPIAMEVSEDTCLVVNFQKKDSVVSVFRSDMQNANKWNKTVLRKEDDVYKWVPVSMVFELSADNSKLYADVSRVNSKTQNVLKPMALTLRRESGTTKNQEMVLVEAVKVTPLPIVDKFNIEMKVKSASTVSISMFNLVGAKVADYGNYQLDTGLNDIVLYSSQPKGEYILKIEGKGIKESLKVLHL